MLILGRACKPREYSLSASSMARQAPLHWRASDLDLAAFLCLCHAMNLRGSSGRFLGESLKHLYHFSLHHCQTIRNIFQLPVFNFTCIHPLVGNQILTCGRVDRWTRIPFLSTRLLLETQRDCERQNCLGLNQPGLI